MSDRTEADRRIGAWSAGSASALAVTYLFTGFLGVLTRPPGSEVLHQVDPYLRILESLMILFAAALVAVMAAVYAYASPDRKTHALVALALTVAFAVLTCAAHFAGLTVGRQVKAETQLLQQLSFKWPSVALAIDLLAWDFFLGLALLFAAPVFRSDGLSAYVRRMMRSGGTLCLAGTFGALLGDLRIQWLAIVGYAFALPIVCILLAILFRREGGASQA